MAILSFDDVSKRIDGKWALKALSLEVELGETYGLLGGRHSGKSTALRIMAGLVQPDLGEVAICGRKQAKVAPSWLAYLPEAGSTYPRLTPLETVGYFGKLRGLAPHLAQRRARMLLEEFGLSDSLHRPVGQLSKGLAQRVRLAIQLVHVPDLILLDEPFAGLTKGNQALLADQIGKARARGATIIYATRDLQHAEKLFDGTLDEARADLPQWVTVVSRQSPINLPAVRIATAIGPRSGEWQEYLVRLGPRDSAGDFLESCVLSGFRIRGFEHRRPSLHDIFGHLLARAGYRR